MSHTALILGVTGQDGAYLSHLLLGKGYRVVDTSRDGIHSLEPSDVRSVLKVSSRVEPDGINNLSGYPSVELTPVQPVEPLISRSGDRLNPRIPVNI